MGRIIAIANQKGGVGKTTTAVNLCASLAAGERNVLLIDGDPQGNATTGLGFSCEEQEKTLYQVLLNECGIEEVVRDTNLDYLKLVPADNELFGAEVEMVELPEREVVLKRSLEKNPIKG